LGTVGVDDVRRIKNTRPEAVEPSCYVLKRITCTKEVWDTVKNGTAVVRDWFVVGVEGEDSRRKEEEWGGL